VRNGSSTTITCSPAANTAWPDSFTVHLKAESLSGLPGCSDTLLDFSRDVHVNKKPNLNFTTPLPGAAVCSDNKNLLLEYKVKDEALSGESINFAKPEACQLTGPDASTGELHMHLLRMHAWCGEQMTCCEQMHQRQHMCSCVTFKVLCLHTGHGRCCQGLAAAVWVSQASANANCCHAAVQLCAINTCCQALAVCSAHNL
jgi:hypothetical protein